MADDMYDKWRIGDEYRDLILANLDHSYDNVKFIENPERMRSIIVEYATGRTVSDIAAEAGVGEDSVTDLMERGYAPYTDTKRILKTLGVEATALPAECVTA